MNAGAGGKPVCIDLFAGCGGLSLGAQSAGWRIAAAIEIDARAAETYRTNFPASRVIANDIRAVRAEEFGDCDHLKMILAGPPCQPFSASNQKSRGPDHPNNYLFREAVRLIAAYGPDIVLFENVEGFGIGKSRVYYDELCRQLSALKYYVSARVFCAADFGVPQNRRRLFILATKSGLGLDSVRAVGERVTVGEALDGLPNLRVGAANNILPYSDIEAENSEYSQKMRGGLQSCTGHLVTNNAPHIVARYQYIGQGENWKSIPADKMGSYSNVSRCHTGIYHRLRRDMPAKVIGNFRKNMLVHPVEDRGLSVREAARLQSIPDYFEFKGSIGKQQQQVGNAVPPLLASKIIEQIIY